MTAPLGTGRDAATARSGTMDGYQWTLRFEPVQLPVAAVNQRDGTPVAWMPLRMIVTVSFRNRPEVTFETIRLARATSS
jgi:hypothetical protein